jgi:hypothetical protein
MRTILILSAIATGLAWAQNSELALLGGFSGVQGQTSVAGANKATIGTVSPSLQVNYAWQILERKAGLSIELPLVIPVRVSGEEVSSPTFQSSVGNSGPDIFFTPGVRLKISPQSRVSFYGAAGFGIASFGATSFILPGPTIVSTSRRNSPALGFGGGIDVRLTRWLSMRGDVRDFVTKKGLGGVTGRNHGIFQAGVAFHF